MKLLIHKTVCLCALMFAVHTCFAQTQDAASLHETARSLMRQGDFTNAQLVLDKGLLLKPDDLDLLKDKAFIFYLQRDFGNSIEISKKLPQGPMQMYKAYKYLALLTKPLQRIKKVIKCIRLL